MVFRALAQLPSGTDYDGVALYSGGTDSTLAPLLARSAVGNNILLLMIDIGEPASSIEQAIRRAEAIGWDFLVLEERERFSNQVLREAIRMRADYWGYPLGTPLGRAFQLDLTAEIIDHLNEVSPRKRFVIHGCAARQNTRYRIERFLSTLAEIEPCGPLTEKLYSREEKVDLLQQFGITAQPGDGIATDQNIYCRAMEGDALNTTKDPYLLPIYQVVSPPNEPSLAGPLRFSLSFESGTPTAVDGVSASIRESIETCSEYGATHGVGRICVFEDTIPELGYKERGIYEAPSAVILSMAHEYLEAASLTKVQRRAFRDLRERWAELVYRGDWHTDERTQLASEAEKFNEPLSGEITIEVDRGLCRIVEAQCTNSILIEPNQVRGAY